MYPKVTFGMIVLNGEPFTRYNLRAIYPYAHQIIVVEGASHLASHAANAKGHSLDGTLDILRDFKDREDPESKITLVTAEDEGHSNGFWPGEKDEQSRAYTKHATGDWLWQVDVDEFYTSRDIETVLAMLETDPSITAMSFFEIPFWGSFDVRCDGVWLSFVYSEFHRLFKWHPSYSLLTHRPPTVVNEAHVNLRDIKWIKASDLAKLGIYLYHYSQIFVDQVIRKSRYYGRMKVSHIRQTERWINETYLSLRKPFQVHTINTWPSWLERYAGDHPHQINLLRADIASGKVSVKMRDMKDAYRLIDSRRYQFGVALLKLWANYGMQTARLMKYLLKGQIGLHRFLVEWFTVLIGRRGLDPGHQTQLVIVEASGAKFSPDAIHKGG